MAPSSTSNPTPAMALALLPKLSDADADLRYMSLNDLYNLLNAGAPTFLHSDYHTSAKIVDGIIQTLDDQNGEVQNQAIKWYVLTCALAVPLNTDALSSVGALVVKLSAEILAPFVHRVSNIKTTQSVDTSIPSTALRTFITSFTPPLPGLPPSQKTQDAYSAISRVLIPRLLGYIVIPHGIENLPAPPPGMLELGREKGVNSDALDVLIEVIRCFGPMLDDREKQALQKTIMVILDDERSNSIIKKKAVLAISLLAVHLPDRQFSSLVSNLTEAFKDRNLSLSRRRLLINVVGSLSRLIPRRLGLHLKTLAPFVLGALGPDEFAEYEENTAEDGFPNPEIEELRESALIALDGFLSSCSNDMRPFTNEAIECSLRFVSYDPMAAVTEDDEEMGGTQDEDAEDEVEEDGDIDEDEDFEADGALSDDDDSSWKIRRCAAKNLYAIISTRSNGDLLDNGTLYEKIAPALITRFKEREENVRLEILNTLASLIRKTGEGLSLLGPEVIQEVDLSRDYTQRSRKRRRVDSNAEPFDGQNPFASTVGLMSPAASPSPVSGPRADLARLSPAIVRGVAKLLKQPSVPTKQAAITLLRDVVIVQNGGLSDLFGKVVGPLIDAVRGLGSSSTHASSSIGGVGAATGSKMRIEALQLVSAVCDTHTSRILSPHIGNIVPSVIAAINDKYYKVSSEALLTVESIVKVLTPPRSAGSEQQRKAYLRDIYEAILSRAVATDADLEVRQQAIHALGILLARTSGSPSLLSSDKRLQALELLQERLRNETTRVSAIKAVDLVIASATNPSDIRASWTEGVTVELAGQLRKADRTLRGASLLALRNLVLNTIALQMLGEDPVIYLTKMLIPLLTSMDLNMMNTALTCLSKMVEKCPSKVVDASFNDALSKVLLSPLVGAVTEALLGLVWIIGENAVGKPLMNAFLQDIGVSGDPAVVGKAIGTLLVSGANSVGVNLDAFTKELQSSQDPQRKCLALSVLGEVGLRYGSDSPLTPQLFNAHFNSKSESVARTAAVSMGRAGAGSIPRFLPVILSSMSKKGKSQYLALHSVKEILQFGSGNYADISPYTKEIWGKLLDASQVEDSKIIGAECIGRITVLDPRTYLPALQVSCLSQECRLWYSTDPFQEYLKDVTPGVRGMAIQALRFTLADHDDAFDEALKPVLVKMLGIMLNDPNIENRRLALTTLNSATHNKPNIILPLLGSLIPSVIKDSKIDPDLIREVQMGPFKHKVDDGLELRKVRTTNSYPLNLLTGIHRAHTRHFSLSSRRLMLA